MKKEDFIISVNLTDFPDAIGAGMASGGKTMRRPEDLTTEQLAAVVCAFDILRFEFQTEFHRRMGVLPTAGFFAYGGDA